MFIGKELVFLSDGKETEAIIDQTNCEMMSVLIFFESDDGFNK